MNRGSTVESEGRILRLAQHCDPTRLALNPQEGFLLSRIDGVTSWKLVRELSGLSSAFVDECLTAWLESGILEVVVQGKTLSVRSDGEQAGAKRSVAFDSSLEISEEAQLRILVFEANLSKPYHEVLGVAEDADAATVKKAYFALSREFHPDRYYGKKIGDFAQRFERIFMRIVEAYELLSDPIARRGLEEARQEAATPASETGASAGEVAATTSSSRASGAAARLQFRKLAHLSRSIAERKLKAKRFYELGMAAAKTENWLDAASNLRLALGFAPENEIYHTSFGPIQVKANELRAERAIKAAETALQYRDHHKALQSYEDAVGLRPHDATLNYNTANLAWTLGGENLRLARECAKAAVELDAKNAEYRLLLGRIYRDAGMMANAKREFEDALKRDPKNVEAKAELKGMR